jgi:hypothetical protein
MADVATQTKKVNAPARLMGMKSSDVSAPILYFEYGEFTIADNATTGELYTDLTNVIISLFRPTNAYGLTGAAYSDDVITSGAITVTTADPNGTATYKYLLIGTVETQ